ARDSSRTASHAGLALHECDPWTLAGSHALLLADTPRRRITAPCRSLRRRYQRAWLDAVRLHVGLWRGRTRVEPYPAWYGSLAGASHRARGDARRVCRLSVIEPHGRSAGAGAMDVNDRNRRAHHDRERVHSGRAVPVGGGRRTSG